MRDPLPSSSPLLGAIDLGSNSFRLEIAQLGKNRYRKQLCMKEMVSLGAGLDSRGMLSREAMDRGLKCLREFAFELARWNPSQVRVVATQTLREARNRQEFVYRAEALLGVPVEVISGHEEARLIHAGVAYMHPSRQRRLVVDIGGRSTELILGQGRQTHATQSFQLGCASISQQFFPGGLMTADAFRAAQVAVSDALSEALPAFGAAHWEEAMGASGTAGSLSSVLKANGLTDGTVTPKGLRWLIKHCIATGNTELLELPGLKPQRRNLLPGGLAILYTLAVHCGIHRMLPAKGALRHGVIVDLQARLREAENLRAKALAGSRELVPA